MHATLGTKKYTEELRNLNVSIFCFRSLYYIPDAMCRMWRWFFVMRPKNSNTVLNRFKNQLNGLHEELVVVLDGGIDEEGTTPLLFSSTS